MLESDSHVCSLGMCRVWENVCALTKRVRMTLNWPYDGRPHGHHMIVTLVQRTCYVRATYVLSMMNVCVTSDRYVARCTWHIRTDSRSIAHFARYEVSFNHVDLMYVQCICNVCITSDRYVLSMNVTHTTADYPLVKESYLDLYNQSLFRCVGGRYVVLSSWIYIASTSRI